MSTADGANRGDHHAEFEAIVARLRDEGWPDIDPDTLDEEAPDAGDQGESPRDDASPESPHDEAPDAPAPPDPIANLPTQWRMPTAEAPSILDEEEFVPDEPRPLPSGDLGFWGAALALCGGIIWIFYLFFFDRYARPLWWMLAIGTALAGLVLVFLRQPHRRDDDWDDDVDGAVL